MVDWNSPTELAKDALVFEKFMHALVGIYLWEWFTSLPFDWAFISGKKPFRWPMIFYFGGRYSLICALIAILIALDNTEPINCQALYIFAQLMGNMSIGLASVNLSVRVMAIYSMNLYVVIPLVLLILGHWSLLLQGVNIKAAFVPGSGCAITQSNNTILSAIFIYTMCFDLVVTSLTIYKLVFNSRTQSSLVKRIWRDGLVYFIIALSVNILATVFILLQLNAVMSVMLDVPSAVASTIVACRAVRRLVDFTSGPEVYSNSASKGQSSAMAFGTGARSGVPPAVSVANKSRAGGVRIEMETFTEADPDYLASGSKADYDLESHPSYGHAA
ncbi:hypothetical protein OE88DRAFT_1660187 [Heliocybe sulcata]|uniref:Transmembrane protein n=1 Tax=Heliocybe sulcata TaxID=5364 RepID=A0A5C3N0L1_9AGAM|nr:hypothetical protein OE88DRAFT_1660187 [Heliocybe sulcata]